MSEFNDFQIEKIAEKGESATALPNSPSARYTDDLRPLCLASKQLSYIPEYAQQTAHFETDLHTLGFCQLRKKYTAEYWAFQNAKQRSKHGQAPSFNHDHFPKFRSFLSHVGAKPNSQVMPGASIDRINPKRGYELDNLRWETKKMQRINQIRTKYFIHEGERYSVNSFARTFAVSPSTVRYHRAKGSLSRFTNDNLNPLRTWELPETIPNALRTELRQRFKKSGKFGQFFIDFVISTLRKFRKETPELADQLRHFEALIQAERNKITAKKASEKQEVALQLIANLSQGYPSFHFAKPEEQPISILDWESDFD